MLKRNDSNNNNDNNNNNNQKAVTPVKNNSTKGYQYLDRANLILRPASDGIAHGIRREIPGKIGQHLAIKAKFLPFIVEYAARTAENESEGSSENPLLSTIVTFLTDEELCFIIEKSVRGGVAGPLIYLFDVIEIATPSVNEQSEKLLQEISTYNKRPEGFFDFEYRYQQEKREIYREAQPILLIGNAIIKIKEFIYDLFSQENINSLKQFIFTKMILESPQVDNAVISIPQDHEVNIPTITNPSAPPNTVSSFRFMRSKNMPYSVSLKSTRPGFLDKVVFKYTNKDMLSVNGVCVGKTLTMQFQNLVYRESFYDTNEENPMQPNPRRKSQFNISISNPNLLSLQPLPTYFKTRSFSELLTHPSPHVHVNFSAQKDLAIKVEMSIPLKFAIPSVDTFSFFVNIGSGLFNLISGFIKRNELKHKKKKAKHIEEHLEEFKNLTKKFNHLVKDFNKAALSNASIETIKSINLKVEHLFKKCLAYEKDDLRRLNKREHELKIPKKTMDKLTKFYNASTAQIKEKSHSIKKVAKEYPYVQALLDAINITNTHANFQELINNFLEEANKNPSDKIRDIDQLEKQLGTAMVDFQNALSKARDLQSISSDASALAETIHSLENSIAVLQEDKNVIEQIKLMHEFSTTFVTSNQLRDQLELHDAKIAKLSDDTNMERVYKCIDESIEEIKQIKTTSMNLIKLQNDIITRGLDSDETRSNLEAQKQILDELNWREKKLLSLKKECSIKMNYNSTTAKFETITAHISELLTKITLSNHSDYEQNKQLLCNLENSESVKSFFTENKNLLNMIDEFLSDNNSLSEEEKIDLNKIKTSVIQEVNNVEFLLSLPKTTSNELDKMWLDQITHSVLQNKINYFTKKLFFTKCQLIEKNYQDASINICDLIHEMATYDEKLSQAELILLHQAIDTYYNVNVLNDEKASINVIDEVIDIIKRNDGTEVISLIHAVSYLYFQSDQSHSNAAIDWYESCAKNEPDNAEWQAFLGYARFKTYEWSEAEKHAAEAIQLEQDHALAKHTIQLLAFSKFKIAGLCVDLGCITFTAGLNYLKEKKYISKKTNEIAASIVNFIALPTIYQKMLLSIWPEKYKKELINFLTMHKEMPKFDSWITRAFVVSSVLSILKPLSSKNIKAKLDLGQIFIDVYCRASAISEFNENIIRAREAMELSHFSLILCSSLNILSLLSNISLLTHYAELGYLYFFHKEKKILLSENKTLISILSLNSASFLSKTIIFNFFLQRNSFGIRSLSGVIGRMVSKRLSSEGYELLGVSAFYNRTQSFFSNKVVQAGLLAASAGVVVYDTYKTYYQYMYQRLMSNAQVLLANEDYAEAEIKIKSAKEYTDIKTPADYLLTFTQCKIKLNDKSNSNNKKEIIELCKNQLTMKAEFFIQEPLYYLLAQCYIDLNLYIDAKQYLEIIVNNAKYPGIAHNLLAAIACENIKENPEAVADCFKHLYAALHSYKKLENDIKEQADPEQLQEIKNYINETNKNIKQLLVEFKNKIIINFNEIAKAMLALSSDMTNLKNEDRLALYINSLQSPKMSFCAKVDLLKNIIPEEKLKSIYLEIENCYLKNIEPAKKNLPRPDPRTKPVGISFASDNPVFTGNRRPQRNNNNNNTMESEDAVDSHSSFDL